MDHHVILMDSNHIKGSVLFYRRKEAQRCVLFSKVMLAGCGKTKPKTQIF